MTAIRSVVFGLPAMNAVFEDTSILFLVSLSFKDTVLIFLTMVKGIVVINRCFLDFSIVIDSDRGHGYEHLKKSNYDEN